MTTTVIEVPGVTTVISDPDTEQTVISAPDGPTTTLSTAAQPGLTGPTGASGTTLTATAGADLSGHRVVRARTDGTVVYATSTDLTDATRDLWLTLGAALSGTAVTLQAFGLVTEPSWSWTDGPVFLGANGVLTQTPPTAAAGAAYIRQVGHAISPTALFVNPRTPIALAA